MIDPLDCQTMADVRAGVDETDCELSLLIARRFRFMNAASIAYEFEVFDKIRASDAA